MLALFCGAVLFLLSLQQPVRAVTYDETSDELRARLPEFLLRVIDPAALKALSLADLNEYADSYQAGEMRFVSEIRAIEHSGPIDPELAALILQVPKGAPFVTERFTRLAMEAYGQQIFSRLQWQVFDNSDGSVSIDLYYASRDPSFWSPDVSYDTLGGFLYGARYQDLFYGNRNKQLEYGAQFSENYPDEPRLYGSWTDNTLRDGRAAWAVSASVGDDWRRRLRNSAASADIRQRQARLAVSYTWRRAAKLGDKRGDLTLNAGAYGQDSFVLRGDPTQGGTAPRSGFAEAGSSRFIGLAWESARRDMAFTPQRGWDYRLSLEQHSGDFPFTRARADLRRYIPLANPLGIGDEAHFAGDRLDVRELFPAASLGVQVQATIADGDVPYSEELRLGSTEIVRGYTYDSHVAINALAARAEYRFALDKRRRNEAFIFTDHAFAGEKLSKLEAFDSYGLGTIVTVPVYGGFKLGAYWAQAFDQSNSSYGLALGYQF